MRGVPFSYNPGTRVGNTEKLLLCRSKMVIVNDMRKRNRRYLPKDRQIPPEGKENDMIRDVQLT